MGNKPSSNISIFMVKETAQLKDSQFKFPVAYQALMFDSYVDNVCQFMQRHEQKGKIPWDEELPGNSVEEWQEYFKMLTQLHKIQFK